MRLACNARLGPLAVLALAAQLLLGTPGATAQEGPGAVRVSDNAFFPTELVVPVGTTVTWTNSDDEPHTATQDGGGFQSNKLDKGEDYSFIFDTAGTYEYHCEFHPKMHGTVVVK